MTEFAIEGAHDIDTRVHRSATASSSAGHPVMKWAGSRGPGLRDFGRRGRVTERLFPATTKHLATRYFLTVTPLFASDAASLALSGLIGALAVRGVFPANANLNGISRLLPYLAALFPLLITYWYGGLYPGIGFHPAVELGIITKLNTTAIVAVMTALKLTGAQPWWYVFFGLGWMASSILVPLLRSVTRRLFGRFDWWGYPAVIIGSGDAAWSAVAALQTRPHCGLRPVGIIDPTEQRAASRSKILKFTSLATGGRRQRRCVASYALVALPDTQPGTLAQTLERLRLQFPHLLLLSPESGSAGLWREARDCGGGLQGVELRNKLLLPWPKLIKRSLDLALTLLACALLSPLFVLVAIVVKCSSAGPLFYTHRRLGRDGNCFNIWKFRTMRADADVILRKLLAADPAAQREWDRDHKLRNDPRITRVGKFLRKTSLDELPQLLNVLVGDMSLVGPRPIVTEEIIKYGRIYDLYSEVRPGVTGLWQVSGRNNTTYTQRVQLDSFYVRNWSPWLDLHLLARTVITLLRREGAD